MNGHPTDAAKVAAATPYPRSNRRCANCDYFRANPTIIVGQAAGKCAMPPPPIVAQLYAMLQQEPMTQINYDAVFNDLPDALRRGACAAWIAKEQGDAEVG